MTLSTAATGPSPTNADDDRRLSCRVECLLEVAVLDAGRSFVPAKVLDLSAGGVRLVLDPPPAPGEELRLTFLAGNSLLFRVAAVVVRVEEYCSGCWAAGCQFPRPLTEKEMAALL